METAAAGWFAIREAHFHLRNIANSTTKYYHVLTALPHDLVAKVLPNAHIDTKYEIIKEAANSVHEKNKL